MFRKLTITTMGAIGTVVLFPAMVALALVVALDTKKKIQMPD